MHRSRCRTRTRDFRLMACAVWIGLALVATSSPPRADVADPAGDAPPPDPGPVVNRAMGIGEARKPQPFTREQRFLHAVRQDDRSTVLRALELGVMIDTRDDLGRSAPLLAVRDAGSIELLVLLRDRGAQLDVRDHGGRTALSYAAARGRTDMIEVLLDAGASLHSVDHVQKTPLFYAATGNHPDAIRLLHARGAALNPRARFDKTPLISACEKDAGAAARALLELGADASLRDHKGRSARDRARMKTPACMEAPGES